MRLFCAKFAIRKTLPPPINNIKKLFVIYLYLSRYHNLKKFLPNFVPCNTNFYPPHSSTETQKENTAATNRGPSLSSSRRLSLCGYYILHFNDLNLNNILGLVLHATVVLFVSKRIKIYTARETMVIFSVGIALYMRSTDNDIPRCKMVLPLFFPLR